MEALVVIIVFVIGYAIISNIIRNVSRKVIASVAPNSSFNKNFRVEVSEVSEVKEDTCDLDYFEVKIKGAIKTSSANQTVQFVAKMHDETNGEKEPVLSTIEEFQSDYSVVFSFQKSEKLPYADTLISDWVTIFKMPLVFLEFPKKGRRDISITFYITNQQGNILEQAEHKISFVNKENGYLDALENRKKFEEVIIKTALLVSNSDGEMDTSEADIIKHWVKTRLTGYNESVRDENKQRLNGYIKDGFSQVKNDEIDTHDVLDEIHDIASDGEKYELYELCLKVASADGKAEQEELDLLNDITDYLNLDRVKLQSMLEKELPINIYTNKVDDEESLIGITPDMDNKQIKKHLVKEYSKWNARVAHKDETIRKQAEEMIQIIVNLRQKYKDKKMSKRDSSFDDDIPF